VRENDSMKNSCRTKPLETRKRKEIRHPYKLVDHLPQMKHISIIVFDLVDRKINGH